MSVPPQDGPPGRPGDDLPEGLPDGFDFDAEFAKAFGAPPQQPGAGSGTPTRPRAIVAVVLTPIASAPALAGLLSMSKIEAHVIPTGRGAVAARVIERDADSDLADLLGEAPTIANELAAVLSRTSRRGAVLLVSRLGEGDEGLVGTIAASHWVAGTRSEEQTSAGLVLAQADDVVERLLFGTTAPQDAPDAITPSELPPFQARRLFRRTQRGKRP